MFDADYFYPSSPSGAEGQVLIDSTVVWSKSTAGVALDQTIDVSSYSGTHTLEFRLYFTATVSGWRSFMFDNVRTYGSSGYVTSGSITSTAISRDASGAWTTVDFARTLPASTTLTVDVLPATGSTPISGYENVSDGADLSGITESTIRLRANLATTDTVVTPALHEWTVSWQETAATYVESDWSNIESSTQAGWDFGDAPEDGVSFLYPTLLPNGARHVIAGPWLGPLDDAPDAEPNGQPDVQALGDDYDLDPLNSGPNYDDEDGVLIGTLTAGLAGSITVEVRGGGGLLDAWIDFDQSGSWAASEHLFGGVSLPLADGVHVLPISVPAGAVAGTTYARFRISTQGGLEPGGLANDGEVEDYMVSIVLPAPELAPEPATTPGTENTVYWSSVVGADEYYVEYDTSDTFSSPDGNSGWITDTQYTFYDLTAGQQYYYHVKARQSDEPATGSWSQTSQAEFNVDALTSTTATADGDVVLDYATGAEITGRITNPSFESGYLSTSTGWTSSGTGNLNEMVKASPSPGMPSNGTYYEQMYTLNDYAVSIGDYVAISQSFDLTGVATLEFDVSLYAPGGWLDNVVGEVLIDGVVRWSNGSGGAYANQVVDVSSYTGTHIVQLRNRGCFRRHLRLPVGELRRSPSVFYFRIRDVRDDHFDHDHARCPRPLGNACLQ